MKKKELEKLENRYGTKPDRGPTFVGVRPVVFKSKRHPSRQKRKAELRKEIDQY